MPDQSTPPNGSWLGAIMQLLRQRQQGQQPQAAPQMTMSQAQFSNPQRVQGTIAPMPQQGTSAAPSPSPGMLGSGMAAQAGQQLQRSPMQNAFIEYQANGGQLAFPQWWQQQQQSQMQGAQ